MTKMSDSSIMLCDNVSDCTKDNADYCFFPFKFMFL